MCGGNRAKNDSVREMCGNKCRIIERATKVCCFQFGKWYRLMFL